MACLLPDAQSVCAMLTGRGDDRQSSQVMTFCWFVMRQAAATLRLAASRHGWGKKLCRISCVYCAVLRASRLFSDWLGFASAVGSGSDVSDDCRVRVRLGRRPGRGRRLEWRLADARGGARGNTGARAEVVLARLVPRGLRSPRLRGCPERWWLARMDDARCSRCYYECAAGDVRTTSTATATGELRMESD